MLVLRVLGVEGVLGRKSLGLRLQPLTTKTTIFVGSYYEALYSNYRETTKKMVLVVDCTLTL